MLRPAREPCGSEAAFGRVRGSAATTRSICATVPAREWTAGLIGLCEHDSSADSAAIEDLPSSMQPTKETTMNETTNQSACN